MKLTNLFASSIPAAWSSTVPFRLEPPIGGDDSKSFVDVEMPLLTPGFYSVIACLRITGASKKSPNEDSPWPDIDCIVQLDTEASTPGDYEEQSTRFKASTFRKLGCGADGKWITFDGRVWPWGQHEVVFHLTDNHAPLFTIGLDDGSPGFFVEGFVRLLLERRG